MKRGKEILLGAIFLLALALLFGGISFLKGRDLFSSNLTYYVRYNDVTGLSNSSPIYVNGVRIGIVSGINYNYSHPDGIVVRIGVNKKLRIPQGSQALLMTELLGTVNVKLELAPDNGRYYAPGDTLNGEMYSGIRSQIAQLMPQLMQLLPKTDSILTNIHQLTSDPSLNQTLHNTEALTADAKSTLTEFSTTIRHISSLIDTYQGVGNKLDTFTDKLNTLSDEERLNALLTNLDATLKNLRTLSEELTEGNGTAHQIIADPTLYNHLNSVCTEASELIEDIKKNPSRYIRLFGRSKD